MASIGPRSSALAPRPAGRKRSCTRRYCSRTPTSTRSASSPRSSSSPATGTAPGSSPTPPTPPRSPRQFGNSLQLPAAAALLNTRPSHLFGCPRIIRCRSEYLPSICTSRNARTESSSSQSQRYGGFGHRPLRDGLNLEPLVLQSPFRVARPKRHFLLPGAHQLRRLVQISPRPHPNGIARIQSPQRSRHGRRACKQPHRVDIDSLRRILEVPKKTAPSRRPRFPSRSTSGKFRDTGK